MAINVTPSVISSAETFYATYVNGPGFQGIYTTEIASAESFFPMAEASGVANVTTTTSILSEENFFSAYIAQGEVVTYLIPSNESFFNSSVTPGTASVTTAEISSSEHVYYPANLHPNEQLVVTNLGQFIESYRVYSPTIGYLQTLTTTKIPSGESVYNPLITGKAVITTSIPTSELWSPISITPGVASVYPTIITGGEVYFPTALIGAPQLSVNKIATAEAFSPININPTVNLTTIKIISSENFFTSKIISQNDYPLCINLPQTAYGGPISKDQGAPLQSFYELADTHTITQGDLVVTNLRKVSPDYIPSTDAMFSGDFYSSLYIQNSSEINVNTSDNIYFWINGGESFTVQNSATPQTIFQENTSTLDGLIAHGLTLTSKEYNDYNLNGKNRSTMFGQVKIGTLLGPSRELVEFNADGSSIGFDLRRQTFLSSTQKLKLPALNPGEHVGIYLKFTTVFNPNDKLPIDYAFLHISNLTRSTTHPSSPAAIDKYPGQRRYSTGVLDNRFLPSIRMRLITNYTKLLEAIDTNVDTLYSKYPPYFLNYKDI